MTARETDLIVPLALKRSKVGIILVTLILVSANAFLLYEHRWSPVRTVIAAGCLIYCIKRVTSSRYLIEIDERGILDGAARPLRIPWTSITDLGCESTGDGGALLVSLREQPEELRIELDGVQAPIQTVMRSATAYWQAAKDAKLARDKARADEDAEG
jgi:hypothetical protein